MRPRRGLFERRENRVRRLVGHPVGGDDDDGAGPVRERLERKLFLEDADLLDQDILVLRGDGQEIRVGSGGKKTAVMACAAPAGRPPGLAEEGRNEGTGRLFLPAPLLPEQTEA